MKRESLTEMLTEIIDSMHDGFFVVARSGEIIMANSALLEMTGYSHDEVVGRTCTIFQCDECRQHRVHCGEHWCQLFARGETIRQLCNIMTKDGHVLHVLKSSQVVRDESGEIIASVENVANVTDVMAAEQRIVQLEKQLRGKGDFCGMVGQSPGMQRLFSLIEKAALSEAAVIVYGESGVGKELVAQAIHQLGPRHHKPFVQINCAAFNESLLESELFGHVRGAFTGAHRHRIGRFEEVEDGDLFLDEVGDIPLPTQVKLLRVLETRQFERVGDNKTLPMDARLISATNQDLDRLAQLGRFRSDFYFRINVVPLHVPPLRERREDIPRLVDFFMSRLRERTGRDVSGITPEALNRLMEYAWPGNVRELRSMLEYVFVVCSGGKIGLEHLPPLLGTAHSRPPAGARPPRPTTDAMDQTLSGAERDQRDELVEALRSTRGNKTAAARILGVTRLTVLNRMRKYRLELHHILDH
jgi:PAS domain S-box-containing protein